jgi:hypothetical protein
MNVPAHLANRQGRGLAERASANLGGIAVARISIEGNRFTFIDATGNKVPHQMLYLDCIAVDANENTSKRFYQEQWAPGEEQGPPTCFSDNGIGASSQASTPQSSSCASCQWNQWGSAVSRLTGKPIRACQDQKKIAVVVPGIGFPLLLTIPPASLKAFASYCRTVGSYPMGDRNADLADVVTRVEFESQGVLKFSAAGWIDEQQMHMVDQMAEQQAKLDEIVGRHDKPKQGLLAAPASYAPNPAPLPMGAQVQPQQFGQPTQPAFNQPTQPPMQGFGQPQQGFAPTQPAPAFAPSPQQPAPGGQPFLTPGMLQGGPAPQQGFGQPQGFPNGQQFGAPPAGPSTGFPQSAPQQAGPAPTASPSDLPKTRRRRTKEEIARDEAAKAAGQPLQGEVMAPQDPGPANPAFVPGFLQQGAPVQQPMHQPPAQQPQWGMVQGTAPPSDMAAALAAAMGG